MSQLQFLASLDLSTSLSASCRHWQQHVVLVCPQAVPAVPESVHFLSSPAAGGDILADGSAAAQGPLFLQVGLTNGVLLRTEVGQNTGVLTDTRTRFLGTRPPKLFPVSVKSNRAMLALTSRPWLGFYNMGRYNLMPLSYEVLDHAAGWEIHALITIWCVTEYLNMTLWTSLYFLCSILNETLLSCQESAPKQC